MNREKNSGVVIGAFVILFGIVLLIHELGLLGRFSVFDLWPLILVVLGIGRVISPREPTQKAQGWFLIAIGFFLGLHTLGFIQIARYWPLILVGVGLLMLQRSLRGKTAKAERVVPAEVDVLDEFVVMGSLRAQSCSQHFQGGDVMVLFGGCHLDLTEAALAANRVELNVRALFGGIEVRVPEGWSVLSQGTGLLGAFEDKTRHRPEVDPPKRLLVRGFAVFGGVELKN